MKQYRKDKSEMDRYKIIYNVSITINYYYNSGFTADIVGTNVNYFFQNGAISHYSFHCDPIIWLVE